MRNLKRALSVALASAMLLGMMMVGTSAKGIDDFTDKDKIVNQDAVAVTAEIGVFDGYENGSFGPENVVTRAEMAVIICTMLYGAGVNVDVYKRQLAALHPVQDHVAHRDLAQQGFPPALCRDDPGQPVQVLRREMCIRDRFRCMS